MVIVKTATTNDPEMVLVEGGTFTMGGTDDIAWLYYGELPYHQVTVSSFYISKFLVTQELWTLVMGDNPSVNKNGVNLPVEMVSWNDVQEFISRLNTLTGKTYRLPTEAEWEYAARGGKLSNGYKYSGSNTLDEVAWYNFNSDEATHPVGKKKANELGIYDMSGNVWEWCSDWYANYDDSGASQTNPTGPAAGTERSLRGSSIQEADGQRFFRVSCRDSQVPTQKTYNIGFRLVRSM